jgi:4-amino-4-deoxy-L-arabinose transferase-like glycosyltransferase
VSFLKIIIPGLLGIATLLYAVFFIYAYYRLEKLRPRSMEWIDRRKQKKKPFTPLLAGKLSSKDILPLSVITVVYAAVTLFNLGSFVSPQSFIRFGYNSEPMVIELNEPARVEEIFHFTGHGHGHENYAYMLEFSSDGEEWVRQGNMTQQWSETFRWVTAGLNHDRADDTRYIRIRRDDEGLVRKYDDGSEQTLTHALELGEISIKTQNPRTGEIRRLVPNEDFHAPEWAEFLFDEQGIIPERYDILNSSQFDEIYHAYTAYEHIRGIYPYETTHPPLGKLITSLGISIFGMTPFGWRFMPAFFGILMLPLLYILLKWMFGKTGVAACGTLLFAFEFMHFVQTRISTIDVYTVFFVLCMALFMFRYFTTGLDAPFWKSAVPLIFAGLSFGLGAAAKWQSIYAGFGMLILFIIHLRRKSRHCRENQRSFLPFFLGTGVVAVFSFIIIPGIAYAACYIPYVLPRAPAEGYAGFAELAKASWDACVNNSQGMYKYHSRDVVDSTHSFSAHWYQWVVNWKPILYYSNHISEAGTRATIWAFNHPLITWAGLGALGACFAGFFKQKSHTALFVLIFYFSNLVPWMLVSRTTYPYHYFPCLLILCVGIAWVFDRMVERDKEKGTRQMFLFTAVSVSLFVLFYPILSGTQMPEWYSEYFLRWMPNWKHF